MRNIRANCHDRLINGGRAAAAIAVLVVLTAVFVAIPPHPAVAGDGDGGTQSVFSIGAGSRAIGMGRAFVSLADDASAVYWNPAALRNVGQTQLMFMYMPMFGDFTGADYVYFGAVLPTLRAGAFGIGFQKIGTTFDMYDELSHSMGEGDYSESQFLISYAFERHSRWLLGTLATGASFKIVNQTVDPFSSTAPGVDVGFRWIPDFARSVSVGVNFQDISGAEHKLDAAADVTYRTVMAGMGYTHVFSNGSVMRLLFQTDMPEKADSRYHAGAEYAFTKYVSLRAGYDEGDFSFGLGVNVSLVGFDYAFLTREEAGSSHPVSVSFGFGRTLDEKRQEIADAEAAEMQRLMREEFENRVAARREQARRLEAEGDFAGALDDWKIVLEYIPGDTEATEATARVRDQLMEAQAVAARDGETQAIIRTRFSKGFEFYEAKNYMAAVTEWEAILAIDSTHAGAREYMEKTQNEIDTAVSGHIESAYALERAGRFTEAIGEWNNVQRYEPNNADAGVSIERLRGRIESVAKDNEAAQERLRTVNLYNDALQMYDRGDYQQAVANLDELLTIQADHEEAKRLRALARRKMTPLTDEEKATIRRLFLAGMQHFAKDEYAKAITEWEKIIEIDPTNDSVRRNIEEARERLRQLEDR